MINKLIITIITFMIFTINSMAQELIDVHQDSEFDNFSVIEWSPDGTRLLLAGGEQAKVVDAETFETISRFQRHAQLEDLTETPQFNDSFILSGAFSEDSKTVITGGYRHVAFIWDVETGEELHKIEFPIDFFQPPHHSAFDLVKLFDNKACTQSPISGANISDISTMQQTRLERGSAKDFKLYPNKDKMILDQGSESQILTYPEGKWLFQVEGGFPVILDEGNKIRALRGGGYTPIRVKEFDSITGELISEIMISEDKIVGGFKFTPSGEQIVTLDRNENTIGFHDINTGTRNASINVVEIDNVDKYLFSPDETKLVAIEGNKIAIYDISDLTSSVSNPLNFDN